MESAKISIINAPQASGADVSVVGLLTNITGLSGFKASLIRSYTWLPSLVTTKQVWAGTATVAVDSVYKFGVQVVYNGLINNYDFEHTATAATGANLKDAVDAWVASIDAFGTDTVITTTGTGGSAAFTMSISGSTARPMVTAYEHTNVTITSNMPTIAPHATAGTAIAGTTTVTVTTLAAQSFFTGQVVTITGATGFTFAGGIASGVGYCTARIKYATATTFTLDGVTGSGTNTGTVTITQVAQEGLGSPTQVTADATANGATQTATVTGYHYKGLEMVVGYQEDTAPMFPTKYVRVRLWYPYNIDTAATTLYTNSASLQTALDGVVA